MAATAQRVSLGNLVFDELRFEVPADLEFTYKTLGGTIDIPQTNGQPAQRVAQTIGVVVGAIKCEAWFIGSDAVSRARQLEAIQANQRVVPFQFGGRSYDVVVFGLSEKYRSINEVAYTLSIEPLVETSSSAPAAGSAATANLQANLTNIATADVSAIPASVIPASVTTAIGAAGSTAVAGASLSDLTSLTSTFSQAQNDLGTVMSSVAGSTDEADVSTFLTAASLNGQLATATATLGTFTGATSTATVPTNGLDAYRLAARYTGDVQNADAIMQANGITDPFSIGLDNIVIPGILTTS